MKNKNKAYKLQDIIFIVLIACFLPLISYSLAPISVTAQTPDPRFGIAQTYDDFEAADELGVGFTRVKLYWDIIQPNGPTDWQPANIPDPLIKQDLAAGREVIGLIVRTPVWARDLTNPANDINHPTAEDVPNMEAWATFVGKLADHYEGRINHWVIWNEPDVWDDNHPGSTWKGSAKTFAELQKTAYKSIKSANPNANVYLTGFTYFWDYEAQREQYLSRLLAIFNADPSAKTYNHYFDGMMMHLYYKPHMNYNILTEIRMMLDVYGLADKTIWLNETNSAPTKDLQEPPHFQDLPFEVTLTEQAAYIIQIHAMAFAAGIERIQLYKLHNSHDFPEDPRPFGLLRGDKSRRPAFLAYKVVNQYLQGFETVTLAQQGNVTVVVFNQADTRVTIVWNNATTSDQLTLQAQSTTQTYLVDELGNQQNLEAINGNYKLNLPPAECSGGDCFIGGAPRLIIETSSSSGIARFSVPPTPTVEPTPSPTILQKALSSKRRMFAFGVSCFTGLGIILVFGWVVGVKPSN